MLVGILDVFLRCHFLEEFALFSFKLVSFLDGLSDLPLSG